jgi:hypothetical protein
VNKTIALIGIGLATIGSSAAMAAGGYNRYGSDADTNGTYWGASAGQLLYSEDGLSNQSPTIAMFRMGQKFSPNLAIELRLGTGIRSDSHAGFDVNTQAVYGAYVKGLVPFGPGVSGYGLAGIGGARIHRNYPGFNTNDAGLSFGVGTEFNVGGGASLNFEWVRLTTGTNIGYDYTADQVTFGVNWRR